MRVLERQSEQGTRLSATSRGGERDRQRQARDRGRGSEGRRHRGEDWGDGATLPLRRSWRCSFGKVEPKAF